MKNIVYFENVSRSESPERGNLLRYWNCYTAGAYALIE
jgi:hypothetical protein